jgi:serine-type D-Ala-D-Ala carboxypeptidase/endopeptidase
MTPKHMRLAFGAICLSLILPGPRLFCAADDPYVGSIKTFLADHFDAGKACIVIGLVDEHGSTVIPWGKLGNGTDQDVNGDSVFFIGSVSKTFTTLLLVDMVERGEMKLEDPAAEYLPKAVKMPTYGGKQITLLDLATHTAGFPVNPGNMSGKDEQERYETYSIEKMYAFLSSYALSRDPGTEFEYSNVGMALLGHVIALQAASDFNSLLVDRIARPLGMQSTRVTLTPGLSARLSMGHDQSGQPSPPWNLQVYAPAGGVFSTANDLLKYVSANAGLAASKLTPLMEETHTIRHTDSRGLPDVPGFGVFGRTSMDWVDRAALQPPGMELLGHAGGAGSYHAWVGFDLRQRRGVVVLTTANNDLSAEAIGWTLLQRLPLTVESARLFARELVGIGVALDLNPQTGTLRIDKVFPRSPAALAGLASGMIIQRVGDVSLEGKSLAECMRLLRGGVGTKVRLEVVDSAQKIAKVELMRQRFSITP